MQATFTSKKGLAIVPEVDNLKELLVGRTPKEPQEITAIKQYIWSNFGVQSSVGIQDNSLVITVNSGSLANTLRFHLTQLRQVAQTDKRIIFRIG